MLPPCRVEVEPVTFRDIVVNPRPGRAQGKPGPNRSPAPPSLERPDSFAYPWRATTGDAQPDG